MTQGIVNLDISQPSGSTNLDIGGGGINSATLAGITSLATGYVLAPVHDVIHLIGTTSQTSGSIATAGLSLASLTGKTSSITGHVTRARPTYNPSIGIANLDVGFGIANVATLDIGYTSDTNRIANIAGATEAISGSIKTDRILPCTIAGSTADASGVISTVLIDRILNLTGNSATVSGQIQANNIIITGVCAGVTNAATGSVQTSYDLNLLSSTCNALRSNWQDGNTEIVSLTSRIANAAFFDVPSNEIWVDGKNAIEGILEGFKDAPTANSQGIESYQDATHVLADTPFKWIDAAGVYSTSCTSWISGEFVDVAAATNWTNYPHVVTVTTTDWQNSDSIINNLNSVWIDGRLFLRPAFELWDQGDYPQNATSIVIPTPPSPVTQLYTPTSNLRIACPLPNTTLRIAIIQCPTITIVPIQRVYTVQNTFSLVRVSDNEEISCVNFSASLDAGSWSWSWSASVDPTQLERVFTDAINEPIEVQATLNGTNLRLVIESISRERSFGDVSVKASGRGRTAWLAAPYSPILTFANTQDTTAQQITNQVLMFNGVSIGWSVNWGLTDWLVRAGAWSQYSTYIEALVKIADAGGGYIQPHDTDKTIKFLPYYPTAPWHWNAVTPDLILPESAISVEGITWSSKMIYDNVYIVGSAKGGRVDRVMRTGMGAQNPAPTVQDNLACDPIMSRQRGIRVLGDCGMQAMVTLKLPILPSTGIIRPGTMTSYVTGGTSRIGIVRSVKIDYDFPEAWQNIEIESNESI
jgi:hypothetical protein